MLLSEYLAAENISYYIVVATFDRIETHVPACVIKVTAFMSRLQLRVNSSSYFDLFLC